MSVIENVDSIALPNTYEVGRQAFISALRRSVLFDVGGDMMALYANTVAPALDKAGTPATTGRDVRDAMEDKRLYRFYTAIRYNAQEMTFESVRPQIERNAHRLIAAAAEARRANPAGGTLRLDPDLPIPSYITALDVHLLPGCFHSEFTENDVLQGARNTYGTQVFGSGLKTYQVGGPGATIAHYLRAGFPDFDPKVIVDLGCTAGTNTFPYADLFPQAEVHGVDVSAPVLRYGHARAEATGRRVHFSQQNAETLDFADDSVDFVTSSFFFHELPVKSTCAILKECHRILKPGGMMIQFELPPSNAVDPYLNFFLDWDAQYNNEPAYAQFRAQDPRELVIDAGFAPESYMQIQLPNWGTVSEERFAEMAERRDTIQPGFGAVSWFTFGAIK